MTQHIHHPIFVRLLYEEHLREIEAMRNARLASRAARSRPAEHANSRHLLKRLHWAFRRPRIAT